MLTCRSHLLSTSEGLSWKVAEGSSSRPSPKSGSSGSEAPKVHLGRRKEPQRSVGACLRLWPHPRAQARFSLPWKAGIARRNGWRLLGVRGGGDPCASSSGRKPGLCKFFEKVNAIGQMLHRAPPHGRREYCREEVGSQDILHPSFHFSSVLKVPLLQVHQSASPAQPILNGSTSPRLHRSCPPPPASEPLLLLFPGLEFPLPGLNLTVTSSESWSLTT